MHSWLLEDLTQFGRKKSPASMKFEDLINKIISIYKILIDRCVVITFKSNVLFSASVCVSLHSDQAITFFLARLAI